MSVLIKNNASSRLATPLSKDDTQLILKTNGGEKFPEPGDGEWFPLTVIRSNGLLEIMRCTKRNGDILTVERAMEGTLPADFIAGDRVELRLTRGAFDALFENQNNIIENKLHEIQEQVDDKLLELGGPIAAMQAIALSF